MQTLFSACRGSHLLFNGNWAKPFLVSKTWSEPWATHDEKHIFKFSVNLPHTPEITEPAPSWSRQGAKLGGLQLFSIIKVIMVHQVCVLPACTWRQASVKRQCAHTRTWTHLFCVCFRVCGRLKNGRPQIEPHGWRCHYTEWYRRWNPLCFDLFKMMVL